jgi:hypothetical protein
MTGKPPAYGPPAPPTASLFRRPAGAAKNRVWSRLSPSEQRSLELPALPGQGRYFWDENGAIVVWYPAETPGEVVSRTRARLGYRVVVGAV